MTSATTSKSFSLSTSTSISRSSLLVTILFLLSLNILPGLTLKSCPHPESVPNGNVRLEPASTKPSRDGKYPSGSQARIECSQGYRLKYSQLKYFLCNENGTWISSIPKPPIDSICLPDTCGSPPELRRGHYKQESSPNPTPADSYPLGTILKPTCDNSYSLNCSSNQCGRIICEAGGTWKSKSRKVACLRVSPPALPLKSQSQTRDGDYDEDTCDRPPSIYHGYYTIEKNQFKQTSPAEDSYPMNTILHPACEKSFSLNCSRQCGRIICQSDGRWAPKDDKFITACVAEPLLVRSNPHDYSKEGHGRPSDTAIKHYLVLGLAVLSVLAVCTLTVLLLRRPTFCKKSRGPSNSSGGGGAGQNDVPVIITSSSPASNMDSLPVAMNTGIFVPGAGYDLQDCHFQESPFVGTQVFK